MDAGDDPHGRQRPAVLLVLILAWLLLALVPAARPGVGLRAPAPTAWRELDPLAALGPLLARLREAGPSVGGPPWIGRVP